MKTKMTIEVEYVADSKECKIRNHLINRLENPICAFGKYRYRLFRALGIGCHKAKVTVKFEDIR